MRFHKQPLTIPFSPKNTTYMGDGFGRDTYILNNNGGLGKSGQRIVMSSEYPISVNDIKSSPR